MANYMQYKNKPTDLMLMTEAMHLLIGLVEKIGIDTVQQLRMPQPSPELVQRYADATDHRDPDMMAVHAWSAEWSQDGPVIRRTEIKLDDLEAGDIDAIMAGLPPDAPPELRAIIEAIAGSGEKIAAAQAADETKH